jgi:malonyl-CoA O-methyltransferase
MLRRSSARRRVCADAHALPWPPATFELINASLIAGDIGDLDRWIDELARVLAPGGHLIYSDFHPSWSELGWRRTFRAGTGEEYSLPCASHQLSDHCDAIGHAGLDLLTVDDVMLTPARSFARWRRPRAQPVAQVFHARKPTR